VSSIAILSIYSFDSSSPIVHRCVAVDLSCSSFLFFASSFLIGSCFVIFVQTSLYLRSCIITCSLCLLVLLIWEHNLFKSSRTSSIKSSSFCLRTIQLPVVIYRHLPLSAFLYFIGAFQCHCILYFVYFAYVHAHCVKLFYKSVYN
jgi:hypothetical protein